MGDLWDAPNQQVVHADSSGPWEEGAGGGELTEPEPTVQQQEDLSALTKAELLERAQAQGVEADETMTKAQIIRALEGEATQ
jgi:hypothetical protein